jgi:hypothetical protein
MLDTRALKSIIGTRKDGRPIYLIQGAEDDPGKGAGGDGSGAAGDGQGSGSGDSGKPADADKGGDGSKDKPSGKYAHLTDIAALQALAERLDNEAATAGHRARETARSKAAADAKKEAQAEIAKLLGLTTDDQDPAKLQSEVQQLRAQNIARDRELLVIRAALAPGMGVDVARLTDSRSFMSKIEQVDPNADDATGEITALIKAAVASDQSLKSAQVRGSSIDHGQGPGDQHNPDLSKFHGADALEGAYAAKASTSN